MYNSLGVSEVFLSLKSFYFVVAHANVHEYLKIESQALEVELVSLHHLHASSFCSSSSYYDSRPRLLDHANKSILAFYRACCNAKPASSRPITGRIGTKERNCKAQSAGIGASEERKQVQEEELSKVR